MPDKPKLNILMLGWEFYPIFAGGMGVVTAEIVHGLTDANIGVHFVIPRLPKKIQVEKVNLTSAADFKAKPTTWEKILTENNNLTKYYIDTVFAPYDTKEIGHEEKFTERIKKIKQGKSENGETEKIDDNKAIYHSDILKEIQLFEDKTALIALESDFDLIHAHDWLTFKAAIRAKHLTGKPVVLHVHATEIDRSGENPNKIVFDIEKECLQQADYIIAVSKKGREDVIHHYGIDPKKVFVIHNSTTFEQQHKRTILSNKDQIVLFLGRITMQKGPEYFIQAAAKVLKYLPNTVFLMVGDGDMLPRCVNLVNDLGIQKNFVFTGFITGEQKERIFASSDLFIMPSVSEPFGIVALEAIKSGTPVIVSKTSGAAEVIDNALKVDFWDVDKMADMIHATLRYKSLKEQLVKEQVSDLDSQNWNHQIDAMIKVYDLAMGKREN